MSLCLLKLPDWFLKCCCISQTFSLKHVAPAQGEGCCSPLTWGCSAQAQRLAGLLEQIP